MIKRSGRKKTTAINGDVYALSIFSPSAFSEDATIKHKRLHTRLRPFSQPGVSYAKTVVSAETPFFLRMAYRGPCFVNLCLPLISRPSSFSFIVVVLSAILGRNDTTEPRPPSNTPPRTLNSVANYGSTVDDDDDDDDAESPRSKQQHQHGIRPDIHQIAHIVIVPPSSQAGKTNGRWVVDRRMMVIARQSERQSQRRKR